MHTWKHFRAAVKAMFFIVGGEKKRRRIIQQKCLTSLRRYLLKFFVAGWLIRSGPRKWCNFTLRWFIRAWKVGDLSKFPANFQCCTQSFVISSTAPLFSFFLFFFFQPTFETTAVRSKLLLKIVYFLFFFIFLFFVSFLPLLKKRFQTRWKDWLAL